jgi:hypothetical protein
MIFQKLSLVEEEGLESSGIGRKLLRVVELRKLNFESLQSQFRNFFLVRNSAIDLVVCNVMKLRRC